MNNTFFSPDRKQIKYDLSETARYLGYKKSNLPEKEIQKLIKKAAEEMHEIITPKGVYEKFSLKIEKADANTLESDNNAKSITGKIQFASMTIYSRDLFNNLEGCNHIILLAATIGPQIDSYIRRAQAQDPVYASICQATGAMYIEEVVNTLNNEIKNNELLEGHNTRPRYSPGYGDVPLTIQKDFFRLLNCSRIGLTLMDTLIMAPEKSVTAFIGIM